MNIKVILWIIAFALIFYVGFKLIPVYYRGIIGIRGVCKENADIYHRYGKRYVISRLKEGLNDLGIPDDKREYSVDITGEAVVIAIIYYDQVDFLDRYKKDFEFYYECKGVLKSVYD